MYNENLTLGGFGAANSSDPSAPGGGVTTTSPTTGGSEKDANYYLNIVNSLFKTGTDVYSAIKKQPGTTVNNYNQPEGMNPMVKTGLIVGGVTLAAVVVIKLLK
jgi:hypothetical protein